MTLVNLIRSQSICRLKTDALTLTQILQWNQALASAPFNCHGTIALVR
jgi:hypothetical protein